MCSRYRREGQVIRCFFESAARLLPSVVALESAGFGVCPGEPDLGDLRINNTVDRLPQRGVTGFGDGVDQPRDLSIRIMASRLQIRRSTQRLLGGMSGGHGTISVFWLGSRRDRARFGWGFDRHGRLLGDEERLCGFHISVNVKIAYLTRVWRRDCLGSSV